MAEKNCNSFFVTALAPVLWIARALKDIHANAPSHVQPVVYRSALTILRKRECPTIGERYDNYHMRRRTDSKTMTCVASSMMDLPMRIPQ